MWNIQSIMSIYIKIDNKNNNRNNNNNNNNNGGA